MASVKMNFSFDEEVAALLRRRCAEVRKPASRYVADLVMKEAGEQRDELAAEGYRVLSRDTAEFAAAAGALAPETWPEWEEAPDERSLAPKG